MSTNPSEYKWESISGTDAELLTRGVHFDPRGYFQKPYISKYLEFSAHFSKLTEVNVSQSSKKGTIRGFHLQAAPFSETKMVTCISGSILDVVIDCRETSPTYGRVCKILLTAHDGKSVVVPKGFAHGFQTLSDDAIVLYCVDERYEPSAQLGINPLSAPLSAIWPIKDITISPQDNCLPLWKDFMQTEAIID